RQPAAEGGVVGDRGKDPVGRGREALAHGDLVHDRIVPAPGTTSSRAAEQGRLASRLSVRPGVAVRILEREIALAPRLVDELAHGDAEPGEAGMLGVD